ncbi:hypothetical protein PCH_Pc13g01850 [Penicillium rubens Wisconsin 54-1255]|uniref:Uncharacterized protein n=1 Tax=Penicillium rubens (strain ATCC 28089 / DSM 1075 / NRRL 1951 / Wisconsin 54-1255) TaxID=500485 RepID=B6H1A5_PENRW|nr:hypothetical protein PCH_Pc13g01850 [Penicillium rubens Wisconsin 54-1255]
MAGRAIYWLAQRFVLFTAENSATGRSFGSAALSGSFEFGEIPVADDLRTSYWELTMGLYIACGVYSGHETRGYGAYARVALTPGLSDGFNYHPRGQRGAQFKK